jgi:ligand-binding SRPBCC domain-containing protein
MPAATDAAITAISLLTVPAAKDNGVLSKYADTSNTGPVPAYLWQHVYSMYGYATNAEVSSC